MSSPEFGSRKALLSYIESTKDSARKRERFLPLDLSDPQWVDIDHCAESTSTSSSCWSSSSSSSSSTKFIDASERDRIECFCCLHCQSPMLGNHVDSLPDLSLLWNQIQFSNAKSQGTCSSTTTAATTPILLPEEPSLLPAIDPPSNQTPNAYCTDCGSSLLSAKAFSQPPGYCEYSGRLICGACFEPRQVVVPWKLVRGHSAFRGNVSRMFAKTIQASFYIPFISIEELLENSDSRRRSSAILNRAHNLRNKYSSVVGKCKCLLIELLDPLAEPLPFHIVHSDMYSIADLVDLLSVSKESVILSVLAQIDSVVKTHQCSSCSSPCLVCDAPVSDFDVNGYQCAACSNRFHVSCRRWSAIRDCPLCSARRLNVPFTEEPNEEDSLMRAEILVENVA